MSMMSATIDFSNQLWIVYHLLCKRRKYVTESTEYFKTQNIIMN